MASSMKTSFIITGVIAAFTVFVAAQEPTWLDEEPTPLSQAELHPIVAPTTRPNVTMTDPWSCVTENAEELYFKGQPVPTGSLLDAIFSYNTVLFQTCMTSGRLSVPCPMPDKTRWCDITTALPESLLPAYSEYASSASSWWSVHSAEAVRVAEECPIMWYELANFGVLGGGLPDEPDAHPRRVLCRSGRHHVLGRPDDFGSNCHAWSGCWELRRNTNADRDTHGWEIWHCRVSRRRTDVGCVRVWTCSGMGKRCLVPSGNCQHLVLSKSKELEVILSGTLWLL